MQKEDINEVEHQHDNWFLLVVAAKSPKQINPKENIFSYLFVQCIYH